jgi:hypothetical protein
MLRNGEEAKEMSVCGQKQDAVKAGKERREPN